MQDDGSRTFDLKGLEDAIRAGNTDAFLKAARLALDDAEWTAFGERSAAAHRRGGDLDLIDLLKGHPGQRVSFATQQFIEVVVPACGPELNDLLQLASDATVRGGSDETPYWMTAAITRWCELAPGNPAAALEEISAGRAPTDITYGVVAAGMKVDRVRFLPVVTAMLLGSDAKEQRVAANLLGRIEDFAPADLATAIAALQTALHMARGENVAGPLRALLAIAVRDPVSAPAGLAAIGEVGTRTDRHVREAIAMEMMFGAEKAAPALAQAALSLLHDTEADETATIDGIDQILSQNLSGPIEADVATLVDVLLRNRTVTLKLLDSYEHGLLADVTGALSRTVTRWLLADTLPLHAAVRDVCLAVHGEPMTFDLDFSAAALTPERAIRIARRSTAVLLLSPEAAASIIVSLMRTGPQQAIPALAATLWDPLLISYWTGPRIYLEAVLPGLPGAVADAVRNVISKLDRYSTAIDKARDLPELRPSQHHRHLAAIKRHREQIAIDKSAREGSVFASLFPTSVMLFGDSAVHDVVTDPGKSIRQETPLAVHEYSHELPRLDVIDPFGTWYQRAHMVKDGTGE